MKLILSLVFLVLTHYIIDDRKLVAWIIEKVKGDIPAKDAPLFLIIEIDQTLHKMILLIVAFWLAV